MKDLVEFEADRVLLDPDQILYVRALVEPDGGATRGRQTLVMLKDSSYLELKTPYAEVHAALIQLLEFR